MPPSASRSKVGDEAGADCFVLNLGEDVLGDEVAFGLVGVAGQDECLDAGVLVGL